MTAIILPFPKRPAIWSDSPDWEHNGVTTVEAISLERCVDWLLDLHQSTNQPVLRRLVSDVLTEIRELSPDCGDGEMEELVLGALASVEAAFDIAC